MNLDDLTRDINAFLRERAWPTGSLVANVQLRPTTEIWDRLKRKEALLSWIGGGYELWFPREAAELVLDFPTTPGATRDYADALIDLIYAYTAFSYAHGRFPGPVTELSSDPRGRFHAALAQCATLIAAWESQPDIADVGGPLGRALGIAVFSGCIHAGRASTDITPMWRFDPAGRIVVTELFEQLHRFPPVGPHRKKHGRGRGEPSGSEDTSASEEVVEYPGLSAALLEDSPMTSVVVGDTVAIIREVPKEWAAMHPTHYPHLKAPWDRFFSAGGFVMREGIRTAEAMSDDQRRELSTGMVRSGNALDFLLRYIVGRLELSNTQSRRELHTLMSTSICKTLSTLSYITMEDVLGSLGRYEKPFDHVHMTAEQLVTDLRQMVKDALAVQRHRSAAAISGVSHVAALALEDGLESPAKPKGLRISRRPTMTPAAASAVPAAEESDGPVWAYHGQVEVFWRAGLGTGFAKFVRSLPRWDENWAPGQIGETTVGGWFICYTLVRVLAGNRADVPVYVALATARNADEPSRNKVRQTATGRLKSAEGLARQALREHTL